MNFIRQYEDYQRVARAIRYLEENFERQPALSEVAAAANLSEYHFQRLFSRWVGISPKRFLQFLTKEHAKKLLAQSRDLLDTTFESGLSSPGRLHDLFVNCEAVTPGEYKQRGEGLIIEYGIHPTPFGEVLVAVTARGICTLWFLESGEREAAEERLHRQWPRAEIRHLPGKTAPLVGQIFGTGNGALPPLHLLLRGTNFQIKVWEALMRIPPGAIVSYEDVAGMIGRPRSVRAVAAAIGKNPVAYLVPCHRVIRKSGAFHQYRWGSERKKALLLREFAGVTSG